MNETSHTAQLPDIYAVVIYWKHGDPVVYGPSTDKQDALNLCGTLKAQFTNPNYRPEIKIVRYAPVPF